MKTWIVIYKEKSEAKSAIIMAKTFEDAVYGIWNDFRGAIIKGIFEVAR
jgi:hypothetical protein